MGFALAACGRGRLQHPRGPVPQATDILLKFKFGHRRRPFFTCSCSSTKGNSNRPSGFGDRTPHPEHQKHPFMAIPRGTGGFISLPKRFATCRSLTMCCVGISTHTTGCLRPNALLLFCFSSLLSAVNELECVPTRCSNTSRWGLALL